MIKHTYSINSNNISSVIIHFLMIQKQKVPKDIIKMIILFADNNKIIMFINKYPELLKQVVVNDLTKIKKRNYIYIKKLKTRELMMDIDLKYLPNLEILKCDDTNITNDGFPYLNNFTDEGLQYLPNLKTLNCSKNNNFT